MATNLSGGVSSRVASFLGQRLRSVISPSITDRAAAVLHAVAAGPYESGPVQHHDHQALIDLLEHDLARIELTDWGRRAAVCSRPDLDRALRQSPYDFTPRQAQAFAVAVTIGPHRTWNAHILSRAAGVNRRTAAAALCHAESVGLFEGGVITQAGRSLLDIDEKSRP